MEQSVKSEMLGKLKYLGKYCPSVTLSTTNPTLPDVGTNPDYRGGKSVTNFLLYGTSPPYTNIINKSLNFLNLIAVNNTNISDTLMKTHLGAIIPKTGLFTLLHALCRLLIINGYEIHKSLA
jgi:hypothetical protein